MDKLSINAKRAIKNYGEDVCAKAYMLTLNGENNAYARATEELGLKKNQVTPAINAGRELKAIEEERGFADTPLADIVAKFEDAPLYECDIPGAPGRITYGKDAQIVGRATRELPPGYFEGRLVSLEIDGRVVSGMDPAHVGGDVSRIFVSGEAFDRITQVIERKEPNAALSALMARPSRFTGRTTGWRVSPLWAGHLVRKYSAYTLGIDSFKVMRTEAVNSMDMANGFDRQDAYLCRIEQELMRYEGRRRASPLDRKVAKLRKILRILKRGLYV